MNTYRGQYHPNPGRSSNFVLKEPLLLDDFWIVDPDGVKHHDTSVSTYWYLYWFIVFLGKDFLSHTHAHTLNSSLKHVWFQTIHISRLYTCIIICVLGTCVCIPETFPYFHCPSYLIVSRSLRSSAAVWQLWQWSLLVPNGHGKTLMVLSHPIW